MRGKNFSTLKRFLNGLDPEIEGSGRQPGERAHGLLNEKSYLEFKRHLLRLLLQSATR